MDVILVASEAPNDNANIHNGLSVIEQALRENGIKPILKHISKFNPNNLRKDSIIGFSSYYESLDEVIKKAEETKKSGNHFVVIGGPGTYHIETNKELLNTGLFDALNMGHASPFIELVKYKHGNKTSPLDKIAIDKGLATKNHQVFTEGAFPDINNYPLRRYIQGGRVRITIPPMSNCPNLCDYCIESTIRVPDVTEKIMAAIIENQRTKKFDLITFSSPTFNKPNINHAKKILSVVNGRPETGFYLDSYQLVNNMKETIAQLDDFNATHVYIGLNAINNRSAKYIGRKIGDTVRTNIESEKVAVIEFLKAKRNVSVKEKYLVSVMLSKAEDRKGILDVIHFLNNLVSVSLYNDKHISIQLIHTIPYPGTVYAHNHGDDYIFNSKKDYAFTLAAKRCSYNNKNSEFLARSLRGAYHLNTAKSKLAMIMGINDLIWAYEQTYDGKMHTLVYNHRSFRRIMSLEKKFILDPESMYKSPNRK